MLSQNEVVLNILVWMIGAVGFWGFHQFGSLIRYLAKWVKELHTGINTVASTSRQILSKAFDIFGVVGWMHRNVLRLKTRSYSAARHRRMMHDRRVYKDYTPLESQK